MCICSGKWSSYPYVSSTCIVADQCVSPVLSLLLLVVDAAAAHLPGGSPHHLAVVTGVGVEHIVPKQNALIEYKITFCSSIMGPLLLLFRKGLQPPPPSLQLGQHLSKRWTFGSKSDTKSLVRRYQAKFAKTVPEHLMVCHVWLIKFVKKLMFSYIFHSHNQIKVNIHYWKGGFELFE